MLDKNQQYFVYTESIVITLVGGIMVRMMLIIEMNYTRLYPVATMENIM